MLFSILQQSIITHFDWSSFHYAQAGKLSVTIFFIKN